MKVGIIGAGNIGSVLARHFRQLGHEVLIANSRGPDTLAEVAKETGAAPETLLEAANGVDVLVLSIPFKAVLSLPKDLLARLPASSPIIDTGNYYPPRDGRIADIDDGMVESEWVSRVIGRSTIKVFNSITADSLRRKGLPKGAKARIALPVAGDNAVMKQQVSNLVEAVGFDAFDVGGLSESWRYQPGTPAYCPDPNAEQLRSLLARADRVKAPKSRDDSAKMLGNAVLEFPQPELVRVLRLTSGLGTFQPGNWFALLRLLLAVVRSKLRGNQ